MKCVACNNNHTIVTDSRYSKDKKTIRRRYECTHCSTRFTTYERVDEESVVFKRSEPCN